METEGPGALAEVTSRSRPHWKRNAFVMLGVITDSQFEMK